MLRVINCLNKLQTRKSVKTFNHFDCKDCIYSKRTYPKVKQVNETIETIEIRQVCMLFRYNYEIGLDSYIETNICRNDYNLCGKHGEYFTPIDRVV